MRISEFAAAMQSRVENLKEDFEITGVSTLDRAVAGQVSFISNEKFLARSAHSKASALIVPGNIVPADSRAYVPLREPWAGVLFLLKRMYPESQSQYFHGVHSSAIVDPGVKLGTNVSVGPLAVIGPGVKIADGTVIGPRCVIGPRAIIGENCLLNAGVIIAHEVVIGNRVTIQSGAVIGGEGFKYEIIGGKWVHIPQVGTVVIEDDVEIGANTCIDRASFTETRIGENTKIDNLVQIAHNVKIGSNCVIVSQSGIAGSSEIGDWTILAASAGVADNLKIGSRVRVIARSGLKDDVKDGETVGGYPAMPFRQFARIYAAQKQLPDLLAEVAKLREKLDTLEKAIDEKSGKCAQ